MECQEWDSDHFRYVTGLNYFVGTLDPGQKKESFHINLPLLSRPSGMWPPTLSNCLPWVKGHERVSVLLGLWCRVSGPVSLVLYLLLG